MPPSSQHHQPLLATIAEWAWSSDPSPNVTPATCLASLPLLTSPCTLRLLAKFIGVTIIASSCINKAPVIRNIHSSKSVIGLSTTSSYGEVIVYSNAAYYNLLRGNPFTAYGEVFMVLMQNFIVVLLIWIYREPKIRIVADVILPLVGYLIYLFVVFHVLTSDTLYVLMIYNPMVLVMSRGSQIIANYNQKQTGAQSLVTTGMNLFSSLIRTVTTIKEVGWDLHILRSYAASISLNMILFGQIVLYGENTRRMVISLKQQHKEQEEERTRKKKDD